MSLNVQVFVFGPGDRVEVVDTPPGCDDSAGFESWRTRVWGSSAARGLGCTLLPVLATGDLVVAPDQVPALVRECAVIRADLAAVTPGPDLPRAQDQHTDPVELRLSNIEAAAARAGVVGGGVIIW
ncbi:hypothetical protein ABZ816_03190 [Actinosynnema sp. NPDC047251]|uniref:Uncharacterized protein n=1 Tax=Saccharothrix espanaensis (strain ATCC 51144 / DSM 44229 / JCM 9112 / NBRC 15066 / NRRL 15764) TaxID=1179773 RepID=K0JTY0_SACES|nr:hypothetical protein [Saccharothrix espanaensis]CCH31260.1 hypothetical protein BN6_39730 [Saccharothrix espanaensis DSM 44229]